MSFMKIPHMETDALPSICSGKGCLKDAEAGTRHCRECSQKLKGRYYRRQNALAWKSPVVGDMEEGWVWIYFLEAETEGRPVKIGYAAKVKSRIGQIQTSCPFGIKLAGAIRGKVETEAFLHQKFSESRLRGEWFARTSSLDRLINWVAEGIVPDYIPGVFRDSETGEPKVMSVDKQIGI